MQRLRFEIGSRRAGERGFTMAELMAVVAIVGILSVVGTTSYRKFVAHSKTAEVLTMFANIKVAQEAYKDETFQYLGPSGKTLDGYYPDNKKPGLQKMNFAGTGTGALEWQRLAVHVAAPVLFVYACAAGGATDAIPGPGSDISVGNWPVTVSAPWYVIKAKADLHGNGVPTVFATGSFSGDIYSAND